MVLPPVEPPLLLLLTPPPVREPLLLALPSEPPVAGGPELSPD
jgi:hypothetical protein